jgi:DNA-binding GntR family transcriptional regulator
MCGGTRCSAIEIHRRQAMATANSLKRLGGVVPLKDRTYLAIKRAIIDGVFRAGDALVEADLAGQ